jgi:hypothetical protein
MQDMQPFFAWVGEVALVAFADAKPQMHFQMQQMH